MLEQRYRWKNKHLREHVDVLDGSRAPTILLQNAVYLNQVLRKWMAANIWVYEDRIIYVGDKLPDMLDDCEIVDCQGQFLVPGYIEPHSHPFQLYNPHTISSYASQSGTTTLINDNLRLVLHQDKKKAFSLLKELNDGPASMYWWCRFDSQTELGEEEQVFSHASVKSWLEHESVLQGGELTGWPRLLAGDDMMLHWIQEAKRMRKKIEGHFPGASEKTLAKMALLGADSDHEAMTGEEVLARLMQGLKVPLRHSSIRPDLPRILEDIQRLEIGCYEQFFLTTDGSPPSFYENGFIDALIKIAIDKGVPVIDAYNMATINIARYYNMEHLHGTIAAGRVASLNFLSDPAEPAPVSVLAKGKWVKRDGEAVEEEREIDWCKYGFHSLELDWDLDLNEDFEFSMPFGIEMVNDVITKPYSLSNDVSEDELPFDEEDECFFMMVDRKGKWRINTLLKGFANNLCGFAGSYTNSGDIILIGKRKKDMLLAFERMKSIGGGMVLVEHGEIIGEIPLRLQGVMSEKPIPELIQEENKMKRLLQERGYRFTDPMYTLSFFSTTHLPYIRITQRGMYDVMNKTVLFPTIMR
ncbi:adenine deaminase C-terminal domain-containing protein [Bacillus massiliglaciei]|uniref:adenine deaminase C-terminal domain-containing protein n=1 Tax=Bacillus massiliglaciei TaxID=1816693 RepID=UPI000B317ABC|nr:adenine deaminase C-terminal domain-containing protein [Bacillus massiliglaciei]